MGILPLKKRVNRNKCSFATKRRMFGVFAIESPARRLTHFMPLLSRLNISKFCFFGSLAIPWFGKMQRVLKAARLVEKP